MDKRETIEEMKGSLTQEHLDELGQALLGEVKNPTEEQRSTPEVDEIKSEDDKDPLDNISEAEAKQIALMIGLNMVKFERTSLFEKKFVPVGSIYYVARWTNGTRSVKKTINGRPAGFAVVPNKFLRLFTVKLEMETEKGRAQLERELVELMIIDNSLKLQ